MLITNNICNNNLVNKMLFINILQNYNEVLQKEMQK